MSAIAARFPDGRLHLQHGPIDLIIEAFGAVSEVERAYAQAIDRFSDILPTLVRELPRLELRPVRLVCEHRRGRAVTVEIEHPPSEEIQ